MNLHIIHHFDPEHLGLLRGLNRKLTHINERLDHMATDAQVAQLKSDVEALIAAYHQAVAALAEALKPAPSVADPAIDEIDAQLKAALAPPASPGPVVAPTDPAPEQTAT